jgi:hypothetical protein
MTDLDEFRAAYEADDNHWWRTESGLHQVVFDEACDRLDAAETEVRDLREHGTPGVMHEVDRAFYDLAVKERNLERFRVSRLEAEARALRGVVEAVREWGPHTPRRVARALDALAAVYPTGTPDDYVCSTCGGLASEHPEDIPPDAPVTGDDDD